MTSTPLENTKKPRVFALLVGINHYARTDIPSLQGSVRDVEMMQTYLTARILPTNLHLKILLNEKATKKAIVNSFRTHFNGADANDIVLFYFSGHGSEQVSPPPLDRDSSKNQTLVCYDSRRSRTHRDLIDKELRYLLYKVSQSTRTRHIVVILDCCHAGDGTRGNFRSVQMDKQERTLDDYTAIPSSERFKLKTAWQANPETATWELLPEAAHISLAACQPDQKAYEFLFSLGEHHGVFTHFLLQTLEQSTPPSYYQLWREVHTKVLRQRYGQIPCCLTSAELLHLPFLGGAIVPKPPLYHVHCNSEGQWIVDCGFIHGLQAGTSQYPCRLALFSSDYINSVETIRTFRLTNALGEAIVSKAFVDTSRIELQFQADPQQHYWALVKKYPFTPYSVGILGNQEETELLRASLKRMQDTGHCFCIQNSDDETVADFRVEAVDHHYQISRPRHLDRFLPAPINSQSAGSREMLLTQIEHMARWEQTANLYNPVSTLPHNALSIEFNNLAFSLRQDEPLSLYLNKNNFTKPLTMRFTNEFDTRLYVKVLYLSERYRINLIKGGEFHLEPYTYKTLTETWHIPPTIIEKKIFSFRNIIKVIVSTENIDVSLLLMEALEIQPTLQNTIIQRGNSFYPTPLFSGPSTRAGYIAEHEGIVTDWMTQQFNLLLLDPRGETQEKIE